MGCSNSSSNDVAQPKPATPASPRRVEPDPAKLTTLVEMGISDKIAREALEFCLNDLDKAIVRAQTRVAEEAAKLFKSARDALQEAENEVAMLESGMSAGAMPEKAQIAGVTDSLTKASCNLDAIHIPAGDTTMRSERRFELERCDKLEARITALRSTPSPNGAGEAKPANEATACHDVSLSEVALDSDLACAQDVRQHDSSGNAEPLAVAALPLKPASAPSASACDDKFGLIHDEHAGPSEGMNVTSISIPPVAASSSAASGFEDIKYVQDVPTEMRIANAECLRVAGNNAFKAGDYNTAAMRYRDALLLDENDIAIVGNLAAAEVKLGDFENAANHADTAIRLSGGLSAKAFHRKGQALEGLGQIQDALKAYEDGLALEPSDQIMRQRFEECGKLLAQQQPASN